MPILTKLRWILLPLLDSALFLSAIFSIYLRQGRKGAKTMEEKCLCMVVADDDSVVCVQDEKCCEEIRENLEPSDC